MSDPRTAWKPIEIETLKLNYRTKGMKDLIVLIPGRSRFSISSKARELKLRAGKEVFSLRGNPKTLWTDEETERLKAIYAKASANELREALPRRGIRAIHKKAETCGLKRTYEANLKSRSDAAKYTAMLNRKHPKPEDADPFQTIVIRPAPKRDAHIVFEAIAQRTPLEQAWSAL